MNIVLVLCQESERLDAESLIGHIAITDGAQVIKEKNTYIDSWIDALIRGLRACKESDLSEVDLIDEPEPLAFAVSGDNVQISYKGCSINAGDIQSFAFTLRSAAALFLETVREEMGDVANRALGDIQDFVSSLWDL